MDLLKTEANSELFKSKIRQILIDLSQSPYPVLPSPANVPKRASVALILRVNPSYTRWPDRIVATSSDEYDTVERLEQFFSKDWVKEGTLEALFIKRAARRGDRWTGHIAFPGGRRDPEDEDDIAAAMRETMEEVGIDLSGENVLRLGNLPQRLVTSSWVRGLDE